MGHMITLESKSKYLAQLLRHKPELLDLDMDRNGWVKTSELVDKRAFSFQDLLDIVGNDKKGRYEMTENWSKIRAVSGHSIPWVNPDLKIIPADQVPEILYHGTSSQNYEKIKKSGYISKMGRNCVHLTTDKEDAYKVGSRHGTPCILVIAMQKFILEKGVQVKSPQGDRYYFVEQDIPVEYIKEVLWSFM